MTSRQKKEGKRKRKVSCSPPPMIQLPPREDHANDSSSGASESETLSVRGISMGEFDEPFHLVDIQNDLRERIVAAAPMLLGRDAHYGREFFTTRVGLCAEGPLVKQVSKVYPFITDKEVTDVWKPSSQPHRYELARCTDPTQLKTFGQQYFKVYGNKPDNAYYSLRFLKACYATFVYEKPVNWCTEALSRMAHRLKNQQRNPQKLGPVAMRCQVEGLCKIISQLSCRSNEANDFSAPASIQGLVAAQEEENIRANEVEAISAPLQETRLKLDAAFKKMRAEDDEAEDALNSAYIAASKETKRLLREGAPVAEYAKKAAEMEELSTQLASLREADATFRAEVLQLELDAATQQAAHKAAIAALTIAQAQVAKARQQSLTLKTPRPFDYPTQSSIPPLGLEGKDTCAYCGLGFVWKAAVLSSCGCFLHAPCVAELMAGQDYKCKRCKDPHLASSPIHLAGPWVAQFGGLMESHHHTDCSMFSSVLRAAGK